MQSLDTRSVNAKEAAITAKESLDFLSAISMPHIFEYMWPKIYIGLWDWLQQLLTASRINGSSQEELFALIALGLPRGFCKTTLVKVLILYTILYTDRRFILVLCSTLTHSKNILSDITEMLDEPNIVSIFGNWRLGLKQDTQDIKQFGFRGRNIVLAGIGAGGSVRGLNLGNERPDVMIFEDAQTKEAAKSASVSNDLYEWMLGTAMKAKSPKRCLTLFIANMYATPNSILRKLKNNPNWTKFIAGGILENGESLWEELQPLERLLAEYRNDLASGHPEIFYSEVLNDENASVNNLVNISAIPEYPFDESEIAVGSFIVVDPSNDKHNSDAVSIGYFEVLHHLSQPKPVLYDLTEGRLSPGDTIRESLKLCEKHNCSVVVIEANAFQYSLLYWANLICEQLGIVGIQFIPIYSGKLSKATRILNMFKEYTAGDIYVHPSLQIRVHHQISAYRPMRADNVDGILDLLTYSTRIVNEFGDILYCYTAIGEANIAEHQRTVPVQSLSPF